MNSQALLLTPVRHGWAVDLSGGTRLAQFIGPGAHARAVRYLERVTTIGASPHRRSQATAPWTQR